MKRQKVVYIQEPLIDALEKRAARELVKVGTFVNDLLRRELKGQGPAPVVVAGIERKVAAKPEKCKRCKGTGKVPEFEGCKNVMHDFRFHEIGRIGACDICDDCYDPDFIDDSDYGPLVE